MKLLLIALTSMLSLSSFAQDSVDFVLYRINGKGYAGGEGLEFQMAKVEMTRARYERMLSENLMMYCRTTKDKNVDLVFYKSQITSHYKGGKTPVGRCEGNGCYNDTFEDLSSELNGASNGQFTPETGVTLDYYMGSVANYEAYRAQRASWDWNLPGVSEIPYVTIWNPANGSKVPVTNSFVCAIKSADTGKHVSP